MASACHRRGNRNRTHEGYKNICDGIVGGRSDLGEVNLTRSVLVCSSMSSEDVRYGPGDKGRLEGTSPGVVVGEEKQPGEEQSSPQVHPI